jgi:hypothetical protein
MSLRIARGIKRLLEIRAVPARVVPAPEVGHDLGQDVEQLAALAEPDGAPLARRPPGTFEVRPDPQAQERVPAVLSQ